MGPVAHNVGQGDGVALRGRGGGSKTEHIGEYDLGVFAGFEGKAKEVDGQEVEKIFVDQAGDKLVDLLGRTISL